MRIVNNRIYIVRGETPTYTASVVDKDTGAPLIIDKGVFADDMTMLVEFVVRKSAYSRADDVALKYDLLLGRDINFHVFDDDVIKPYNALDANPRYVDGKFVWDNSKQPLPGDENRLHVYSDNNEKFYLYYSEGEWKDYEFTINVTFQYKHTSVLESKTYQYEITLLGGTLKTYYEDWETPVDPVYKKPLLGLTDFIVEGSISE